MTQEDLLVLIYKKTKHLHIFMICIQKFIFGY
jgi:hypothetical protein